MVCIDDDDDEDKLIRVGFDCQCKSKSGPSELAVLPCNLNTATLHH